MEILSSINFEKFGYKQLTRSQQQAIESGVLENKNTVIVMPLGDGKTYIAELRMDQVISEGGQAIFLSTTKVLNNQKYERFYPIFSKTRLIEGGIRKHQVKDAFSTASIICSTPEKFFYEIFQDINRLNKIKLVVLDDAHVIVERRRGPRVELFLSFLHYLQKLDYWDGKLLLMSGTMPNYDQIADWLNAGKFYSAKKLHENEYYYVVSTNNNDLSLVPCDPDNDSKNDQLTWQAPRITSDGELFYPDPFSLLCLYFIKNDEKLLVLVKDRKTAEFLYHSVKEDLNQLSGFNSSGVLYHHSKMLDHDKNNTVKKRKTEIFQLYSAPQP
ncbi:MAG: DEAD/DEAH box helicase [Candidatus Heimdallarchaeota archaeon]|nr:DEAD/DEAH box helicase [Candidatus Heimdallarchaeota archaeon]